MRILSSLKMLFILVISILSFMNGLARAQQNLPNQELLNNIEIMESVLDRIIAPERGQIHFFSSNTKGYYLMNYGVIFNVGYSLFSRGIISIDLDKRLRVEENKIIIVGSEDEEDTEDFDREMEKLKKSIVRFLGEWTSALSDLNPDEKVTVIVDFNGFFPTFQSLYAFSTSQLIASVPIKDVANYRRGRITKKEFINKITFDEVKSVDEDISILSNVIQTSLKYGDQKTKLGVSGDVKGIHFKGYGVIFFTDVSFGIGANNYKRALTIYSDALKKDKGRSITVESFSNESEKTEKDVKKLEQKLIHLISNYGHNLRRLQPNEWVEIAINFKGMPVKDKYSKSILKVQKRIIDDYNRERIKFEQFKKMVRIVYY